MTEAEITDVLERGGVEIEWDHDDLYFSVDQPKPDCMLHVCVGRMYSFVGVDREVLRTKLREATAQGIVNAEDNARRIVACVNALAGLDPSALAELIEAAEAVGRSGIPTLDAPEVALVSTDRIERLRAALARVKGGRTCDDA